MPIVIALAAGFLIGKFTDDELTLIPASVWIVAGIAGAAYVYIKVKT